MTDRSSVPSYHSASRDSRGGLDGAGPLADVYRQLVEMLGVLDRAGEHVTAAYLAAAVDELEGRLPPLAMDGAADGFDGVDRVADAMTIRFGTRAAAVARGQRDGAEGDARVAWSAIVRRLDTV